MRRLAPLFLLLASQGCAFPPSRAPVSAPPPAPLEAAPPVALEPPAPPPAAVEAPAAPAVPAPTDEPAASDDAMHEGEEGEGDEEESGRTARTSPRIELTDEQIASAARNDPASLGPLSFGTPNAGYLIQAVAMPADPRWQLIGAPHVWGTQETIEFLTHAIGDVNKRFADTPPLTIGHISAHHGGYLSPHKSHQAGRDVDLGFYYSRDARWFARATAQNLDLPRTWALLKALINDTDVDMIFIDTQVQHLLARHAVDAGDDAAYLDRVFQVRGKSPAPVIRHVKGHATHIHVRFHSPRAQEMARRAQAFFKRPAGAASRPTAVASRSGGAAAPSADPTQYVMHRARSGDVLVNLARQYNTTPEAIARANGLQGNALKIGHVYRIPVPYKAAAKPAAPPAHGRSASRTRG